MIEVYCSYCAKRCGCILSEHYGNAIFEKNDDSELYTLRCNECDHDTRGASDEECEHSFLDRVYLFTEENVFMFVESEPTVNIRQLKIPKELIEFLSVTRNGKEKILIDNREDNREVKS